MLQAVKQQNGGGGEVAKPKNSGQRLDSIAPEIFDSIHL